ncbi:MAG: hypothetical protein Q7R30_03575 [Acidobacteriota bacterium]|nr:hypothetical protein [Acidobacteriota bacterium]
MSCLYRVEAQDGSTAPSGFIELRPPTKAAVVPSADSPAILPITLELGHGMRLLGLDAAQVVDLVRALRRDPS